MPGHFTIVELSGHIIDTHMLARVIRALQKARVSYQVNDFQIGAHKSDTSVMQISIWADRADMLENLLMELRPMGAVPLDNHPVKFAVCAEDGVLPPNTHVRWNPPTQILLDTGWIPVDGEGCDLTIVFDADGRSAQLRKVSEVRKGERIVVGRNGIKVLPTV